MMACLKKNLSCILILCTCVYARTHASSPFVCALQLEGSDTHSYFFFVLSTIFFLKSTEPQTCKQWQSSPHVLANVKQFETIAVKDAMLHKRVTTVRTLLADHFLLAFTCPTKRLLTHASILSLILV